MSKEDRKIWLVNEQGQKFFIYETEKCDMEKELNETIQRLQKRIEELEVENKVLKKANNISENITIKDITNFMNKSLEDFNKEYIPVFLVEEKIEEIDQENLGYSENEWYLESEVKEYATEKLQELLKDGGN